MQKLNKNQVLVYIQSLTPINSLQQQFSSTDFLEEANKQEVEIVTIFESSRFGRKDNENENEPKKQARISSTHFVPENHGGTVSSICIGKYRIDTQGFGFN